MLGDDLERRKTLIPWKKGVVGWRGRVKMNGPARRKQESAYQNHWPIKDGGASNAATQQTESSHWFRPISLPCRPLANSQGDRRQVRKVEKARPPIELPPSAFGCSLGERRRRRVKSLSWFNVPYLINSRLWAPGLGPTFPSGDCPATGETCRAQPNSSSGCSGGCSGAQLAALGF